MNMLFLMNKTKDQISWVSSHDLYWENKMYKRKRSIELLENNFESLFAGADNEKAVDNFILRTDDLLTDLSGASVESDEPPTKKIRECAPKRKHCSVQF